METDNKHVKTSVKGWDRIKLIHQINLGSIHILSNHFLPGCWPQNVLSPRVPTQAKIGKKLGNLAETDGKFPGLIKLVLVMSSKKILCS